MVIERMDLGHPRARALLEEGVFASPARLDLAALAIALVDQPEEVVAPSLAILDQLAARVRERWERTRVGGGRLAQIQALRHVLSDEEGFHGNLEDYFAPENSFLNVVLERKVGLPITLSVLYLEVARRAGIPLFGVGFPAHFVVASEMGEEKLVLDPFNGGEILTEAGLEDLLHRVAPHVKFSPKMVTPTPVKSTAYRMLNNLKRVYQEREALEPCLRVIDLLLTLAPDHPGELRMRAQVLSSLGAYRAALNDIERCLELFPDAPDHQNLVLTAKSLRQRVEHLH